MFKNSKMLKGMVLALAFVLVLGAGVLLKLNANAEGNTVVYYVSDSGNNTTGKDAATAFRSFEAATEAANKLNLAPGTELKFIVVDQVFIQTRELDKNTVKDRAGNKVHITITSADPGSKSTILHYAYNSSGSTAYEKIFIDNDITFKDIIISGQVQDYYQGNASVTSTLEYGKFYRTRGIHIGSNTVEFDNCELTSTFPEQSAAKSWTLFCDDYAASTVAGGSHLRLLNGNYSNVTVYTQDQITPLWDLSLYVENASVGTVYALADTDQAASINAKSVTCRFKDATVSSYNPQGRGQIGVTNGVTAIFEGDTVVNNWVSCMAASSGDSPASLDGDLRYIFRDNCNITTTKTDSNESKKIIFLTPFGVMNGNLHVTVEGGTFNNAFATGADQATAVINGNVYNEFKGGTFKAGIYGGMGGAGGVINGTITNNFYDGVDLASTSYLAGRGAKSKTVTNNFYGGTIGGTHYLGGGNGFSTAGNVEKNILDGDLINNYYGGTFSGTTWGGPHSQTITGALYNNFYGGTFKSTIVAGGIGVIVDEMYNTFTNAPDGSHAVISGTTYLAMRGRMSETHDFYNVKRVYNTFEGDVEVNDTLYCSDGSQKAVEIEETVVNEFKGGTFAKNVYCGTKTSTIEADIINNFYEGVTFKTYLYGGGPSGCGTSASITNNVYGGTFESTFIGGNYGIQQCDVTNNVYGGHFVASNSTALSTDGIEGYMCFLGGSWLRDAKSTLPTITSNIYGGTFEQRIYFGGKLGTVGKVDVLIAGGIFNGDRIAGGMYDLNDSKKGNVTISVKPDESNNILLFGCHAAAKGVNGNNGKSYASQGLENFNLDERYQAKLYGAEKPIYIRGNTLLNFDEILGEVTLVQTEDWVNGNVYVTVPQDKDIDMIRFVNVDENLSGSAAISTKSFKTHAGENATDCNALVGSNSASTPDAIVLPSLEAVSFVLDNNLYVNFYVGKAALENYLSNAGAFTYNVTVEGEVLASGTIHSMDEAQLAGTYVKIASNFAVAAFNYNATITIDFAGNSVQYTVYELLKIGVGSSASAPALENLLKSIYNYGVEAEKLRFGQATADLYEGVAYTGAYNGKASATSADASYKFVGTGLSLGKDVSLNFYLKAGSVENLSFTAASAKGELDASRIVVTPFDGNSQYNVVITLKLDVASMSEVFTLTVKNAAGSAVATCSTSVAYGCVAYINQNGEYAPVSKALLTYVEKTLEYKNS